MADVFGEYKPLRNFLKKVDLISALGAIRWYINQFQLKKPPKPPGDMQIDPAFWTKGFTIFLPWQMAVLAREVIINSELAGHTHDFRRLKDMANGLNKLKHIDNYVGEQFVGATNIHHFVSKVMAHQQFMWQENKPNHRTWTRYYMIYSNPQLRPIFENFFGMTVEKYYIFSMITWGNYMENLGLNYPPDIKLGSVGATLDDYKLFVKHYALPLGELRAKLNDPVERHYDYDFLYYFDALKQYPMVLTEMNGQATHLCPVPTYLFWRTTDGIYYELLHEKGFDQAIGEGYKAYVGDVLNAQKYPRTVTILDADTYINKELPKPDWIFIDGEHAAFVECKAKRMTIGAKNELNFTPVTEEQLQKLAESIVQCYKAIIDAKAKGYKDLKAVKHYHPIVATLEPWYVLGDIAEKLEVLVNQEMTKEKLDVTLTKTHPYVVLSSFELENLVCVLTKKPLGDVLPPFYTDAQYDGWQFDTYLGQAFKSERTGHRLFDPDPLQDAIEKLSGRKLPRPTDDEDPVAL